MWLVLEQFEPKFTVVIFLHYKAWIVVAILDLLWMKTTWSGYKWKNILLMLKLYHENFRSETPMCRKLNLDLQNYV